MAVIRIKDDSGNWVNIPALDGEQGASGKVPNITLQTYSSTNAEVQQSGTAENPVIKLGLPKAAGSDTSSYVTLTGNRGVVANYASCNVAASALTIDQNANEYNQLTDAGTITVVDGAANTEWCKTVMIVDANTAIEFGENWNWIGDELPKITSNCVLVCYWCNDVGMARVIDGADA